MNEARIRERLHDAIGDASYPAGLSSRVESRLREPVNEQHPRAIALVAAILALAIVAVLLGPRLLDVALRSWRRLCVARRQEPAACAFAYFRRLVRATYPQATSMQPGCRAPPRL